MIDARNMVEKYYVIIVLVFSRINAKGKKEKNNNGQ